MKKEVSSPGIAMPSMCRDLLILRPNMKSHIYRVSKKEDCKTMGYLYG